MQKMPFHFGLFYYAMIGLLGRKPDLKVCLGYDGFYEFRYKPKDAKEKVSFIENARVLSEWLNEFDIQFSSSRCEYGKPYPPQPKDGDVLQIKISVPKKQWGEKPSR